jgi:hypothetical protein
MEMAAQLGDGFDSIFKELLISKIFALDDYYTKIVAY